MNTIMTILQNKHTSIAGVVYLALKTMAQLAVVWWPEQKDKLETTSSILEGAAVAYGLIAAGDASKSQKDLDDLSRKTATAIQTSDTSMLVKPDVTTVDLNKPKGTP